MAKLRDILGHVTVEIAARQRKCHHSRGKHSIARTSAHLAVKGGAFGARKNYCLDCARPILNLAKGRIAEIERELENSTVLRT